MEIISETIRQSTESFIKLAKKEYGDLYDYSKVIHRHSDKKVIIICKIHGEFEQTPRMHLKNPIYIEKCPDCNLEKRKDDFINKANIVHDNKYDYSKVNYINYTTKVIIICPLHREFEITPKRHSGTEQTGCALCYYDEKRYTKEMFIEKANLKHNNKYDYSKVIYTAANNKVIIICSIHGEFEQRPGSHLFGKGCRICGNNNYILTRMKTFEQFIEESNQIHNNYYDYSKVNYIDYNTKIIIICPKHGEFQQHPKNHCVMKHGCIKCATAKTYSNAAIEWLIYIMKKEHIYIQHALNDGEYNIPGSKYAVDGFCKETNTVYEYDGDLWHGNLKYYNSNDINPVSYKTYGELYNNTIKKREIIISLGYNLIHIWDSEWKELIKSVKIIQRSWRYFRNVNVYEYKCHKCLYKTNNIYGWNDHIKTKKHNL
jgi:hypothetical protein